MAQECAIVFSAHDYFPEGGGIGCRYLTKEAFSERSGRQSCENIASDFNRHPHPTVLRGKGTVKNGVTPAFVGSIITGDHSK